MSCMVAVQQLAQAISVHVHECMVKQQMYHNPQNELLRKDLKNPLHMRQKSKTPKLFMKSNCGNCFSCVIT